MQKLHADLGLSLRFAPLVAFTETERTWAEAVNTAGYQGFFLLWQEHRRASLALAPAHPPPLLTRTSPPRTSKDGEQGLGHAGRGRAAGHVQVHPTLAPQGKSQGLGYFPALQSHTTGVKGKKKKKGLHKTNPTGFPHNNPLPGVVYLHCFSHLLL